jgi:hypothetical protein
LVAADVDLEKARAGKNDRDGVLDQELAKREIGLPGGRETNGFASAQEIVADKCNGKSQRDRAATADFVRQRFEGKRKDWAVVSGLDSQPARMWKRAG